MSHSVHISLSRSSLTGYDREGTKYFEIIDLVENKQIFTAEITELDEDLVLKDKYGIIRFCVHGWQDMGVSMSTCIICYGTLEERKIL